MLDHQGRGAWRPGLVLAALFVLIGTPTRAVAQSSWDTAAFAGVFAVHSPVPDNESSYEDWFHTGAYGVSLGRHLTRHWKLELEAAGSGTARQSVFRYVALPGFNGRYPLSGEAETTVRWLSAAATYQFYDNEWVHPFLSAGVNAQVQRRTTRFFEQPFYPGDPRFPGQPPVFIPEQRAGPESSVAWRPVIGGGVKVYVSPRAFLRAEARATLGSAPGGVVFRGGFGIDF
jgi:hypothetical protein